MHNDLQPLFLLLKTLELQFGANKQILFYLLEKRSFARNVVTNISVSNILRDVDENFVFLFK